MNLWSMKWREYFESPSGSRRFHTRLVRSWAAPGCFAHSPCGSDHDHQRAAFNAPGEEYLRRRMKLTSCVRSIAVRTRGRVFGGSIRRLIGQGPTWCCSARMSQRHSRTRKPLMKRFARRSKWHGGRLPRQSAPDDNGKTLSLDVRNRILSYAVEPGMRTSTTSLAF
jgi:hypothetical protein